MASIVVMEGTGEARAPSNLHLHSLSSRGKSTCCVGMKGEVNWCNEFDSIFGAHSALGF